MCISLTKRFLFLRRENGSAPSLKRLLDKHWQSITRKIASSALTSDRLAGHSALLTHGCVERRQRNPYYIVTCTLYHYERGKYTFGVYYECVFVYTFVFENEKWYLSSYSKDICRKVYKLTQKLCLDIGYIISCLHSNTC